MVEEIVDAVKAGAQLKGVICEKPLARNLAEARRMVEAGRRRRAADAPTSRTRLHMKCDARRSGRSCAP